MSRHQLPPATATSRSLPAAIILMALTLLAYASAINAPFHYDDMNNIVNNPHIRMTRITPEAIVRSFGGQFGNRPLASLTLALNYRFNRHDVRGYHAVNLLIHFLTAWLMFLVARHTLRLTGTESDLIPLLASALWLVNPVHTQSVTYTVQRMNSLAAMFFMLALYGYIKARIASASGGGRARSLLFYALCLTAGLLGLASKENAATLPVMLFLYEWVFFQNLDRPWLKKQLLRAALVIAAIIVLAALYLGTSPLDSIRKTYLQKDFTPAQRLLTEPAVVLYYVGLLLFPHPDRLALIHDFPVFLSPASPLTALAGMLGLAALVIGGLRLSGKQRLLSFAVFWFLGNLAIESSVLGLELVFEHRTYLPSIFPFMALTALAMKPPRPRSVFSAAVLCGLIAVCGLWTWQRNSVWDDGIRFWRDNAAKAPNHTTVHNNLGQALLLAGNTEEAEAHLNRAIAIAPDCDHFNNLGLAMMQKGELDGAIDLFYQALRLRPGDANTHFNLGTAWFQKQDLDRSREHLQQAARLDPNSVLTLHNLATVLATQKKYGEAADVLIRLADLKPESASTRYNLACVYALQNRKDEAVAALKQAIHLGYDNWSHLKTDPDLKNIQDTDYFKTLMARQP